VGSFAVSKPGPLAYDTVSGTLWMIESGTSNIVHYSTSGTLMSQSVSVASPTALAVGSNGDLLVGDNGPDQNVKIFSNIESTPTLSSSLGNVGGQSTGTYGMLNFGGVNGVGTDSSGNIYVTMNGIRPGVDTSQMVSVGIRSFTPSGTENWELHTNSFVDTGVLDPQTMSDVYSKTGHYTLNLSQPAGQQATQVGVTQNTVKYPNDPRFTMETGFAYPVAVRYIDGQKFLYYFSMYQSGMLIYRFDGETAVPSGWLSPTISSSNGPGIWRDTSGDGVIQASEVAAGDNSFGSFGMYVDSQANIWSIGSNGFTEFPPQGLDSVGNPIYTESSMKTYAFPSGYSDIERVIYIPETDTLYVGGYLTSGLSAGSYWGQVGATFARFNNYTKSSSPTMAYRFNTSFNGTGTGPKSVDVAGNAIFMQDGSEQGSDGQGYMYVYDANTGAQTAKFMAGSDVGGLGWTDIPGAIHAYVMPNGHYLIFLEDDVHAKILMYSW
jgi:hypothetical protein